MCKGHGQSFSIAWLAERCDGAVANECFNDEDWVRWRAASQELQSRLLQDRWRPFQRPGIEIPLLRSHAVSCRHMHAC